MHADNISIKLIEKHKFDEKIEVHLLILGPSCLNLGRAVLKNMGRVVLVRDFIGPSGLVRVVFGPSCL